MEVIQFRPHLVRVDVDYNILPEDAFSADKLDELLVYKRDIVVGGTVKKRERVPFYSVTKNGSKTYIILYVGGFVNYIKKYLSGIAIRFGRTCKIEDTLYKNALDIDDLTFDLKPQQSEVVEKIIGSCKSNLAWNRNVLVLAKPGSGKTVMAIATLILLRPAKVLIIVPNINLMDQWTAEIKKFMGDNIKVEDKKPTKQIIVNDDTTVIRIATVSYASKHDDMFGDDHPTVTIYDEVHMYCSEIYRVVFQNRNRSWLLNIAMTGTESRETDGLDMVFYQHFGGNVIRLESGASAAAGAMQKFKGIVEVWDYPNEDITAEYHEREGYIIYDSLIKSISSSDYYNNYVANIVSKQEQNTLIFVKHLSHVNKLYQILNGSSNAGTLVGGDLPEHRDMVMNNKQVLITTLKCSSTGLSFNNFKTIIYACPVKANLNQSNARIMRSGTGDFDVIRKFIFINIPYIPTCVRQLRHCINHCRTQTDWDLINVVKKYD